MLRARGKHLLGVDTGPVLTLGSSGGQLRKTEGEKFLEAADVQSKCALVILTNTITRTEGRVIVAIVKVQKHPQRGWVIFPVSKTLTGPDWSSGSLSLGSDNLPRYQVRV